MMNKLHCYIPDLEGEKFENSLKRSFEEDSGGMTDMQKRVNELQNVMSLQRGIVSGTDVQADTASQLLYKRMQKTQDLLGQINVTPIPSKRSASYKFFLNVKRRGRGRLDEALASIEAELRLQTVDNLVKPFQKTYGLTDGELGLAKVWAAQIGWQPFISDYDSVTSNGFIYLKSEQQRLYKYLSEELSFSDEDIEKFVEIVSEVPKVYHEVLLIANDLGLNIDDLSASGKGYVPYQLSKDFRRRMTWKWEDEKLTSVSLGGDDAIPIQRALEKSRESYEFVVEDEVVLDWMLRTGFGVKKPQTGTGSVYDALTKLSGQKVEGVTDLFSDSVMKEAVVNVFTDEQLEHLVQTGVISKFPVSTDKFYRNLISGMKLPYSSINDLMQTDFGRGLRLYQKQLETLATDAQVTWAFIKSSTDGGWGIPASVVKADPDKYEDFVRLSEAFPPEMINRYHLDGINDVLTNTLEDTYVHRMVVQQYAAEMKLARSPELLGVLGHGLQFLKRFNTTMWLSSSQFLGRQYINNATQLFSAGGNLFHYVEDTVRLTWATVNGKHFIDVLDDTKPLYKIGSESFTEKGLFKELIKQGYINDYTQAITEASSKSYVPKDNIVRQFIRTSKQLKKTWDMYPEWFQKINRLSQTGMDYVDELVNGRIGAPFRWGNVQFENLAKLNLAKSVFSKDKSMVLTGALTNFNINSMDKFVEYSARYFYWYDETSLGVVGDAASYILPFFNYRVKNINGTFRQLIHNPSRFGNYLQLYAALNAPMQKEDFPAGGVPDYVWSQQPVFFKLDKERTGLKQDSFFYFPTASLIQQMGTLSDLQKVGELLGVNIQQQQQTPVDMNPAATRSNVVQKILDEESWGWLKLMKAVATGIDPDTGYEIDKWGSKATTFLGVETSIWTKYALASIFPPLDKLDKWNPGRVFGQQAYYDPYKQEFVEGTPSFMGVERNRKSSTDQPVRFTNDLTEFFGIKGNFVDVAFNMGATRDDIKRTIYQNRDIMKSLRHNMLQATTEQDKARYEAQFYLLRDYTVALRVEFQKVDNWMKVNGFPTRKGLRYLKEQGLRTQDLPDISDDEYKRIQREVYSDNNMRWTLD